MGSSEIRAIVQDAGIKFWEDDVLDRDDPTPPQSSTMARWTSLGALARWQGDDAPFGYHLTEIGEKLFDDANATPLALFRTLAEAEADDKRAEVLQFASAVETTPNAAATELRYARLVAHEVRNALLPVRYELKKVWQSIDGAGITSLGSSREKVDEGITRLYEFAQTSARMTAPMAETAGHFAILEVLEQARRELLPAPSGSVTIETVPGAANPRCPGHRSRLLLAVTTSCVTRCKSQDRRSRFRSSSMQTTQS